MKPKDLISQSEAELNRPATRMLVALNSVRRVIYGGTANPKKAAARHARNKVARKSRQVNRRG